MRRQRIESTSRSCGLEDSSSDSWSSWFQEWKISGSEEAAWASCEKLGDEAMQKLKN
jgi:hypothetical protein